METELRRGYSGTAKRKRRQQTNRTYCHRATSLLYRERKSIWPLRCARIVVGLTQFEWEEFFGRAESLFARVPIISAHGNHEVNATPYFSQFA